MDKVSSDFPPMGTVSASEDKSAIASEAQGILEEQTKLDEVIGGDSSELILKRDINNSSS